MARVRYADWVLTSPWTIPRAHALRVLALHGRARVSTMFNTSFDPPTVFRAPAVWLEARGHARISADRADIELTETGRKFVRFLDSKERV